MLATEGYAYLDIDQPVCAWATYRGALVCPPAQPGFLSVWSAGLLRNLDPVRIRREGLLERVRLKSFPDRVSRLRGMFCFQDLASAEAAQRAGWGDHFVADYLAELSLAEATGARARQDANWITNWVEDEEHAKSYWLGVPYPGAEPIWETILEGRFLVLGVDIRERAYSVVRSEFPDSLMILEISRLAAWAGSNLGNIIGFLHKDGNSARLSFIQDWVDAKNQCFLDRLKDLIASGHPIRRGDLERHLSSGSFGRIPDLRPYEFEMPLEISF